MPPSFQPGIKLHADQRVGLLVGMLWLWVVTLAASIVIGRGIFLR